MAEYLFSVRREDVPLQGMSFFRAGFYECWGFVFKNKWIWHIIEEEKY